MGRRIGGAEFAKLFDTFTDSAFRMETLETYREPHEQDAVHRFITGAPPDDRWAADYLGLLRRLPAEGRRIERVRVLSCPPTVYQRFVMDLAARCNAPAGERLRVLDAPDAARLAIPLGFDFWLFDNRVAALMNFDDGVFTSAVLVQDPIEVDRLRMLRRVAWEAAVPDREQDFAVHR